MLEKHLARDPVVLSTDACSGESNTDYEVPTHPDSSFARLSVYTYDGIQSSRPKKKRPESKSVSSVVGFR